MITKSESPDSLFLVDISPYGRNALIAALPLPDALSYKAPPYAQQAPAAMERLKSFMSNFTKALGRLRKWQRRVI
ncbi:hypothetical protein KO461_04145 [Aggregatibacter actinomycetemcomitans]|uniref:hypothetical protein n=1 Tax=Aggregatibacter actinomycetemcomitans TaxID=714 RepID=UPI001E411E1E|nr:hypothetical protein [Aggregatibacter actinomycetemcomitans]UEL54175.1 hypothetical protein KO461_04145 [Aggregatibacter actinomycetemcomitans]